jgi:hypothetical protein
VAVVAGDQERGAVTAVRPSPQRRRERVGVLEELREHCAALGRRDRDPEVLERAGDPQGKLWICHSRPVDRSAHVRVLRVADVVALAGARLDRLDREPGRVDDRQDQGPDRVELGAADRLGRLERAAAGEDGEPGEEALLALVGQVMAPRDRVPQRPLPLGQVARTAGQERQALV